MRKIIRWTDAEEAAVVSDYQEYDKGGMHGNRLRGLYKGRTIAAIREKARVILSSTATPMTTTRKNPVYAAIENRMKALGYGPEVIKSIISPRKVNISAALISSIESYLSSTPDGKAWWFFAVDANGIVKAQPLREGQDLHDVVVGATGIRLV